MTARTSEYSDIQWHLLPVSTLAACLTRIGRIDFDKLPTSFFRFVGQLTKEGRPRGISNALGQTMAMGHPVDLQVFHADDPKAINDLSTLLMGKVISTEMDTLMDTSNNLAMRTPLRCPFCKPGMLALDTGQNFFLGAKKAGIGYLFFIAESSKGFESHVNPHLGRGFWQALWLTLDREGHVPLASRGTSNSTRFDFAFEGTMIDHLDAANLGKRHTVIIGDTEATLREGEGVIAVTSTETRVARLLTSFDASKERFESQINTDGYILQDLRMHLFQGGTFLFQQPQRINLMIARERFSLLLIGCFPFLKKMVVEPTTLIKGFVQLVNLFLRRKDTILKHFMHTQILAQSRTYVNSFSPPVGGAPSLPVALARGREGAS